MSATPSPSPPAASPRPLAPIDDAPAAGPRPTFRWAPAEDATGYRLQVAPSRDFDRPLLDTTVPPSTTYTLDQPLSGRTPSPLFWRIRAERADDEPTAWSTPQSFTPAASDGPEEPVRQGRTSAGMALAWVAIILVSFVATMGLLIWAGLNIP